MMDPATPVHMVGTVTRTFVKDTRPTSGRPSVVTMTEDAKFIAKYQFRVYHSGVRYRTEWLDGTPRRVFNGTQFWDFNQDGTLRVFLDATCGDKLDRASPYLFPLPPQPLEGDTVGLKPLSEQRVSWNNLEYIEITYPVHPDEPSKIGYKHLIDPGTGYLMRISYGDDDVQTTEWSDVREFDELPDSLFTVA